MKYKVWYKETQSRIMSCYVDEMDEENAEYAAREKGFDEETTLSFEETELHVSKVEVE